MKIFKVILSLFVMFMLVFFVSAVSAPSAHAQSVLISTIQTGSFAFSVSTFTGTKLISNSTNTAAIARIKNITITWEVTSSTGSITLYDYLRGANPRAMYSVVLPSCAISQVTATPLIIQEKYTSDIPKVAKYGLMATHEGNKSPRIVVDYW